MRLANMLGTGIVLAALAAGSTASASTGALIEVLQPMVQSESGAIVLHAVTFSEDAMAGPGQEIDLIDRPNAVFEHGKPIDTNPVAMFGIDVSIDWHRIGNWVPRPEQGAGVLDTLPVTISLRRADAARGTRLTDGLLGTNGLARVLAATEAAVFANARRSWPPVRYVRLEVIPQNAATSRIRVERIEALPKPRTY